MNISWKKLNRKFDANGRSIVNHWTERENNLIDWKIKWKRISCQSARVDLNFLGKIHIADLYVKFKGVSVDRGQFQGQGEIIIPYGP